MKKITTRAELREAIAELEQEQAVKKIAMKEQFAVTYEYFNTASILKRMVSDLISPPNIVQTLLHTAVTIATGYFSRKEDKGNTGSIFKDILGTIIEHGVANMLVNNADTLKNAGKYLFNAIFSRTK